LRFVEWSVFRRQPEYGGSAAPSPSKDHGEAGDYIRKQVEELLGEIKK
jgi:hypothetical protein